MKSSAPHATVDKADAQAAGQGVAMVDNRAVAVAQRQALAAIDSSPRQVAQRQQTAAAAPPRNTTGLPDNLKAGVENLSGYSLDDVTVHYNSAKPAQLQAHAYAQGTDIHVAPGQEQHLPHEAWHVVQQKQGRVKATKQMRDKVGANDNAALEKEADVMGAKSTNSKLEGNESKRLNNDTIAIETVQMRRPFDPQHLVSMDALAINYARQNLLLTAANRYFPAIGPEIFFLESGNNAAGGWHVLDRHLLQMENPPYNIASGDTLSEMLNQRLEGGDYSIATAARGYTLYFEFDAQHFIRAQVGTNGFIVTAYPFTDAVELDNNADY